MRGAVVPDTGPAPRPFLTGSAGSVFPTVIPTAAEAFRGIDRPGGGGGKLCARIPFPAVAIRPWLAPRTAGGVAVVTFVAHAFGNIAGIGRPVRVKRAVADLAPFANLVCSTDSANGRTWFGLGPIRAYLSVVAPCTEEIGVAQGARGPTNRGSNQSIIASLTVAVTLG